MKRSLASILALLPLGHAKRGHFQEILSGENLVFVGPANG